MSNTTEGFEGLIKELYGSFNVPINQKKINDIVTQYSGKEDIWLKDFYKTQNVPIDNESMGILLDTYIKKKRPGKPSTSWGGISPTTPHSKSVPQIDFPVPGLPKTKQDQTKLYVKPISKVTPKKVNELDFAIQEEGLQGKEGLTSNEKDAINQSLEKASFEVTIGKEQGEFPAWDETSVLKEGMTFQQWLDDPKRIEAEKKKQEKEEAEKQITIKNIDKELEYLTGKEKILLDEISKLRSKVSKIDAPTFQQAEKEIRERYASLQQQKEFALNRKKTLGVPVKEPLYSMLFYNAEFVPFKGMVDRYMEKLQNTDPKKYESIKSRLEWGRMDIDDQYKEIFVGALLDEEKRMTEDLQILIGRGSVKKASRFVELTTALEPLLKARVEYEQSPDDKVKIDNYNAMLTQYMDQYNELYDLQESMPEIQTVFDLMGKRNALMMDADKIKDRLSASLLEDEQFTFDNLLKQTGAGLQRGLGTLVTFVDDMSRLLDPTYETNVVQQTYQSVSGSEEPYWENLAKQLNTSADVMDEKPEGSLWNIYRGVLEFVPSLLAMTIAPETQVRTVPKWVNAAFTRVPAFSKLTTFAGEKAPAFKNVISKGKEALEIAKELKIDVPSFAKWSALEQGSARYSNALKHIEMGDYGDVSELHADYIAAKEGTLGVGNGLMQGYLLHGLGVASSKFATSFSEGLGWNVKLPSKLQFINEKGVIKPLENNGYIDESLNTFVTDVSRHPFFTTALAATANGTLFGASSALDQWAFYGQVDPKATSEAFGTGLAFSLPGVIKSTRGEIINTFFTSDRKMIKTALRFPAWMANEYGLMFDAYGKKLFGKDLQLGDRWFDLKKENDPDVINAMTKINGIVKSMKDGDVGMTEGYTTYISSLHNLYNKLKTKASVTSDPLAKYLLNKKANALDKVIKINIEASEIALNPEKYKFMIKYEVETNRITKEEGDYFLRLIDDAIDMYPFVNSATDTKIKLYGQMMEIASRNNVPIKDVMIPDNPYIKNNKELNAFVNQFKSSSEVNENVTPWLLDHAIAEEALKEGKPVYVFNGEATTNFWNFRSMVIETLLQHPDVEMKINVFNDPQGAFHINKLIEVKKNPKIQNSIKAKLSNPDAKYTDLELAQYKAHKSDILLNIDLGKDSPEIVNIESQLKAYNEKKSTFVEENITPIPPEQWVKIDDWLLQKRTSLSAIKEMADGTFSTSIKIKENDKVYDVSVVGETKDDVRRQVSDYYDTQLEMLGYKVERMTTETEKPPEEKAKTESTETSSEEPAKEPILPVKESPVIQENPLKSHRQNVEDKFKQSFMEKGISEEEVNGALAIMSARARAWGLENNKNPDLWYDRIADVRSGAVETLTDGKKVIHALNSPDFSTMVHEIAHVFEADLSESELSTMNNFGGREAFARGFERYLREGKSPTPELESLFIKFKEWLREIYSKIKGSPIEKKLTPEMRDIYDRLLGKEISNISKPKKPVKHEWEKQAFKDKEESLENRITEKEFVDVVSKIQYTNIVDFMTEAYDKLKEIAQTKSEDPVSNAFAWDILEHYAYMRDEGLSLVDPAYSDGANIEDVKEPTDIEQLSWMSRTGRIHSNNSSAISTSELGKIVTLNKIADAIFDAFKLMPGQNIRGGFISRWSRNAEAIFLPQSGIIRVKSKQDINSIAHELGHDMDRIFFEITNKDKIADFQTTFLTAVERADMRKELLDMLKSTGYPELKVSEGIAEFFTYYIFDPAFANNSCPTFYNVFDSLMRKNQRWSDGIDQIRHMFTTYDNYDIVRKATANRNFEYEENWLSGLTEKKMRKFKKDNITGEVKNLWERGYKYNMFNRREALKVLDEVLRKKGLLSHEHESAYAMMLRDIGSAGRAEIYMCGAEERLSPKGEMRGPFRMVDGNVVFRDDVRPLGRIIKDIKKTGTKRDNPLHHFSLWMEGKRNLELYEEGKGESATLSKVESEDLVNSTQRIFSQEMGLGLNQLEDWALEIRDYTRSLLDFMGDAGILGKEDIKNLSKYQYYIPFMQSTENLGSVNIKGKNINLEEIYSPVHAVKEHKTGLSVDPIAALFHYTSMAIRASDRNMANTALVDMLIKLQEQSIKEKTHQFSGMVVEFPEKEVKPIVQKDGSVKFIVMADKPHKQPLIPVIREGADGYHQKHYYEIPKDLYESLYGTDAAIGADTWIGKIMSEPSKWLRMGAVELNPTFPIRNIPRDLMSALFYYNPIGLKLQGKGLISMTEAVFHPGNFILGAISAIKKDKYYADWKASGADMAFFVALDQLQSKKYIPNMINKELSGWFKRYTYSPMNTVRDLTKLSEIGTRVGAFRKVFKHTGDMTLAMEEARKIAADYAIQGNAVKMIGLYYPFLNARLQHLKLTAEQLNPFKPRQFVSTIAKGFSMVTVPSMILWMINNWTEDAQKRYQAQPLWKRMSFFLIPIPGTDEYFPIPRGFWGVLFGSTIESYLDSGVWTRQFENALKDINSNGEFERYARHKDLRTRDNLVGAMANEISPMTTIMDGLPQAMRPPLEVVANRAFFLNRKIMSDELKARSPSERYTDNTLEMVKSLCRLFNNYSPDGVKATPVKVEHLLKSYMGGIFWESAFGVDELMQEAGLLENKETPWDVLKTKLPVIKAFTTGSAKGTRTSWVDDYKNLNEKLSQQYNSVKAEINSNKDVEEHFDIDGIKQDMIWYFNNKASLDGVNNMCLFLDKYIKMMKKEGVILNYSGGNLEEIDVPKIELDKYIEANETFIVAMVQEVLNAYEENRTFSIEKTQELWIQMTGYNRYKKVSTKESNQKFLEIFKDKPQQQENNQD